MRSTAVIWLASTLAGLAACSTIADVPVKRVGQATLTFADGRPAGTAQLAADGTGLRLVVAASGFPPGEHGMHLHGVGTCEGPDFASAGGHLNPGGRKHGTLASMGPHLGDLPNLMVKTGGLTTATEPIGTNAERALADIFDVDGTALVIHAGPDDYRTDPSGNSGGRLACGVFSRLP